MPCDDVLFGYRQRLFLRSSRRFRTPGFAGTLGDGANRDRTGDLLHATGLLPKRRIEVGISLPVAGAGVIEFMSPCGACLTHTGRGQDLEAARLKCWIGLP